MSTKRQLVVLGVGIAVIALALTLVQRVLPSPITLESWTATPKPVDGQDLEALEATCRDYLDLPEQDEYTTFAERRGPWNLVVLDNPLFETRCLMTENLVGQDHLVFKDFLRGTISGRSDDAAFPPRLPADGIRVDGPRDVSLDVGEIDYVSGWVGDDVTAVQLHDKAGPDIDATVDGGRFVLWFPASESPGDGPDDSFLTYTLTLSDGSTREHDAWLDGPGDFS